MMATDPFERSAAATPPFSLPLFGSPDPSTWYVAQWYGSTVWAHRNFDDIYSQGQGIHFGIDFATPCGTAVHAIGDGVIFAVDGPYGAPPHNVVIDHGDGYLSLYGHLLRRSNLRVGQRVSRGDVIGVSGDPVTPNCNQASHLHLEIRRTGMSVAVNPVPLIDADWRRLTIGAGTDGTRFELFSAEPGRWMTNQLQPDTRFGGPILNQQGAAWPPG
jgi:murein DD-endopeptidase MepM/ murein hydrolase activator NlpD